MHRLLERQLRRTLGLDAQQWSSLADKLRGTGYQSADMDTESLRALSGLPALLERVSETYAQQDRDLSLVRRSLDLSSRELTGANQRLLREAEAMSQALATLQSAFDALRKGAEGSSGHDDDLVSMAGKIVDLTREQERIRAALMISEERFDLAVRGANDGLWDYNVVLGTVYYSPRWKEMLGYAQDEVGNSLEEWSSRIHPDDWKDANRAVEAHLWGETPHLYLEYRVRHKDGHYLWVLSRGQAVRDATGQAVRMVGTHTDITRRVELERHLAQFKHALDEHAIVSIADIHGNISYANDKFCRISGYSREELLGGNHRILKSGVHPDSYYRKLWATISAGDAWTGEICNRAKDGHLYWVLATISPIMGGDGLPEQYIAIRADISRIKEAENALIHAKDAAESASRSKSEFLANMSHEIRTPMNGVMGMLNLALDTPLDDEQREYLKLAQSSADSLLRILNDILDLSKIEAGRLDVNMDLTELGTLLKELGRFYEPRCREKGLSFSVSHDPSVPDSVMADPIRLRQVLMNLLSNALKFTHTGEIRLEVRRDGDFVRYAVRDTGIGIPREQQTLVFEAFAQADGSITRRYGGTGLGLTISNRLAQLMGGHMGLESEVGHGSEFFIVLPLLDGGELEGSEMATEMPSLQSSSAHTLDVLLAEDNPVNQKIATLLLERLGHRVMVAENGESALSALANQQFDLVLMDMQMPEMGGLEATRLIRAGEKPGVRPLPIIALTANAYAEDRAKCLEAGMNGFVTKPIRREELFAAIASVMQLPAQKTG
jgi:two-component system, sensor histidine kinase and response regulator